MYYRVQNMNKLPLPQLLDEKFQTLPNVCIYRTDSDSVLDLRHRVLRPNSPITEARFDGDEERNARHYAIMTGEPGKELTAICCLSLYLRNIQNNRAWQLRGMATDARYQRQGYGGLLLRASLLSTAQEKSIGFFWCNARVSAEDFYVSHGWKIIKPRKVFEIPGVGNHVKMTCWASTTAS